MALAATAFRDAPGRAATEVVGSAPALGDEPGGRTVCWEHIRIRIFGSIVVVMLANPPANALCQEMFEAVRQTFDFLEADAVHAVILTGEGENFSVGADLSGVLRATSAHVRETHRLLDRIESFPKPVIAAVNGHCLGGGLEIALACHIRIASRRAKLGLPEVSLGLMPGMGGTHRLPRLVGRARAHEIILTGRTLRADEAAAIGLVNTVVPPDDVLPAAERLARRIAAKSPAAVRAVMRCLNADCRPAAERAGLMETEGFEELTQTPGVRRTLHAIERDLGGRRENDV